MEIRKWSYDFKEISLVFIIWRSILFLFAGLSGLFLRTKPDFLGKGFAENIIGDSLWNWANFDGEHYLWIATHGYRQFEHAFFPFFPYLIKFLGNFFGNELILGLLISNFSCFVMLYFVYKLFELETNKEIAFWGTLSLLAFVSSFYLVSVYSESLYMLLVALSFYFSRKGKFFLSYFFGSVAVWTRVTGVLILPAFLFQKKINAWMIIIGLSFLGLLGFYYIQTKDPFIFIHVQNSFGAGRSNNPVILPPQVLFRYFKILITNSLFSYNFFIAVQELSVAILGFVLTIFLYLRLKRLDYLIYCLLGLLIPTLTGTLSSMPRYILSVFPIFLAFPLVIKNRFLLSILIGLFFAIQLLDMSLFLHGYWIA